MAFQTGELLFQTVLLLCLHEIAFCRISVNYVSREGKRINVSGQEGDDVMRLAQRNNIEIEGACEGSVACSTCHVYIDDSYYDKLETATEEEDDMLDMAPFLKPNSRLGNDLPALKLITQYNPFVLNYRLPNQAD